MSIMNNIFEIEKLNCSYGKSKVVLKIEQLSIPKGKVVFFVGPSGIGKSTILETLGIMNKTVATVDRFEYNGRDISSIWSWKDDYISKFRNENFSFIFQQFNLMPNFTSYENVMLPSLIQCMPKAEALSKVRSILKKMNLPEDDRSIAKFSGGQKQRLAFARAILTNFKVIFADEPTGNLDANSAHILMNTLRDVVVERGATGIIVSHDMSLAVEYADEIIQIHKVIRNSDGEGDDYYGLIDSDSIYRRNDAEWSHCDAKYTKEELTTKLMSEI